MLESLLAPPFAADPPVKMNVPAKTLGLILAILGAIGALFGILGVFALLALSMLKAAMGPTGPGILLLVVIGVIILEIGTVGGAWGGYQMYQEKREGKKLAIYGVLINVVGSLIAATGGVGWSDTGPLFTFVIGPLISIPFVIIYYLVVISRFPGEAPLVARNAGPSAT